MVREPPATSIVTVRLPVMLIVLKSAVKPAPSATMPPAQRVVSLQFAAALAVHVPSAASAAFTDGSRVTLATARAMRRPRETYFDMKKALSAQPRTQDMKKRVLNAPTHPRRRYKTLSSHQRCSA